MGLTAGLLAPESLCDRVVAILRSEAAHKRGTQRVVIGDLASLHRVKRRADQEEALVVLGTILQRAQIPLVLYETVALEPLALPSGSSFGLASPIAADVADVELRLQPQAVESRKTAQGSSTVITTSRIEAVDLRSGDTIPLDLGRSMERGSPAPPAPPPRW